MVQDNLFDGPATHFQCSRAFNQFAEDNPYQNTLLAYAGKFDYKDFHPTHNLGLRSRKIYDWAFSIHREWPQTPYNSIQVVTADGVTLRNETRIVRVEIYQDEYKVADCDITGSIKNSWDPRKQRWRGREEFADMQSYFTEKYPDVKATYGKNHLLAEQYYRYIMRDRAKVKKAAIFPGGKQFWYAWDHQHTAFADTTWEGGKTIGDWDGNLEFLFSDQAEPCACPTEEDIDAAIAREASNGASGEVVTARTATTTPWSGDLMLQWGSNKYNNTDLIDVATVANPIADASAVDYNAVTLPFRDLTDRFSLSIELIVFPVYLRRFRIVVNEDLPANDPRRKEIT